MRVNLKFLVIALGLALTVAGCGAPPKADMDAAKAALDSATAAGAGEYAGASLTAAQDAQTALDAELKAQEGNWFKSYTKAKELAAAVKTAGDKAAADAATGKETAKNEATTAIGEAKTLLTEAQALLAKAPKGKGSAADIEAMKTDLATAATAITEAESALGSEKFLAAKAKAESARNTANTVKTAVEAAMAAKKK
jgi:hypothetical protein